MYLAPKTLVHSESDGISIVDAIGRIEGTSMARHSLEFWPLSVQHVVVCAAIYERECRGHDG